MKIHLEIRMFPSYVIFQGRFLMTSVRTVGATKSRRIVALVSLVPVEISSLRIAAAALEANVLFVADRSAKD